MGRVELGHFVVIGNSGFPGGLRMDWAGRDGNGFAVRNVFQPVEFANWGELWWAVRRRCEIAGLEMIGQRMMEDRGGGVPIVVEVRRMRVAEQWRKRRRRRWVLGRHLEVASG